MLVGGGTSIMPRVAPALYDFVELDNGDYLRISEAVFRIFDRQEWLRVNRARARIKVFVDKYGIDELRKQVEEELKGDWVDERDFSSRAPPVPGRRARVPPAQPASYGSPNGDLSEFERFRSGERARAEAGGLRDGRGEDRRAATSRRSSSAAWRRSCASIPAATRARRCSRTSCCAGCARSACTTSGALSASWASAMRARARSTTSVSCPGTDSLQARHHQLDGPQRGGAGAHRSDGHHRRADAQIQHQDQRLPERLRPAPRRSHRLHGASIKVGEHTIPAYIPHVGGVFEGGEVEFGTRLKLRLPSKRVPDAIERWIRHYEANRNEGEEWNEFVARVGTPELEGLVKDLSMPVGLRPGDDEHLHRLEPRRALRSDSRRGRVRGIDMDSGRVEPQTRGTSAPSPRAPSRTRCARRRAPRRARGAAVLAFRRRSRCCSTSCCASTRARTPGEDRDDRHGRAVPRDAADVARSSRSASA